MKSEQNGVEMSPVADPHVLTPLPRDWTITPIKETATRIVTIANMMGELVTVEVDYVAKTVSIYPKDAARLRFEFIGLAPDRAERLGKLIARAYQWAQEQLASAPPRT